MTGGARVPWAEGLLPGVQEVRITEPLRCDPPVTHVYAATAAQATQGDVRADGTCGCGGEGADVPGGCLHARLLAAWYRQRAERSRAVRELDLPAMIETAVREGALDPFDDADRGPFRDLFRRPAGLLPAAVFAADIIPTAEGGVERPPTPTVDIKRKTVPRAPWEGDTGVSD